MRFKWAKMPIRTVARNLSAVRKSKSSQRVEEKKYERIDSYLGSDEVLGTGRRHVKPISVFLILLILLSITEALYNWIQID